MNIQSAAALASQASMNRGGKNQVRQTDITPQIVQISQAQTPAVGALAPLVMPVPDYESAHTLQQALAAISSFGNVVAQTGNYVQSEKNDTRREAAEQAFEVQKAANASFETWQTGLERLKLDPNFNANLFAQAQDPTGAISAQVDPIIAPYGDYPLIQEALRNRVAQQYSTTLAPAVSQYRAGNITKETKAFAEQLAIEGPADPSLYSAFMGRLQAQGLDTRDNAQIASSIYSPIVVNAAINGNKGVLPKLLDSMPAADRELYANSLTLKYNQTIAQITSSNEAKTNQDIQDSFSTARDVLGGMKEMDKRNVPLNLQIDASLKYISQPGTTNQAIADMKIFVPQMSEQQKAEFRNTSSRIISSSENADSSKIITGVILGKVTPEEAFKSLNDGLELYDPKQEPWDQKPGSISEDMYSKTTTALKGSYDLIKAHQDLNDIVSGKKELSNSNLNKAGLEPSNYPAVALIATQRNATLPSDSTTALFADLSKGSGPGYDDALTVLARLTTSNIELDVSSNQADSSNMISARKTILGLRENIKFDKDGNLDQGSKKMLTMALSANANSARNYSSPDAHMEAMAKQNTVYSDRPNLQKNIEVSLDTVMGYAQNGPGIWWSDTTVTDSSGKFFGDRATSDQMRDEVFAETMKEIASGNRVIATTEYTTIAEKALRKVASQYNAIQYGGTTYGVMKSSYLDARGFDVNNLNSSIEKELQNAKLPASDIREIMPIGFDENNHILISVITTQGKYRLFSLPDQKRAEVVNQKSAFEQKMEQSNANYIKNTDREIRNRAGKQ
jgi:hypothetical protein